MELNIATAEQSDRVANTTHVCLQRFPFFHFQVVEGADVVHGGEFARRGVCLPQEGHHPEALFQELGAVVKACGGVPVDGYEDESTEPDTGIPVTFRRDEGFSIR